RLRREWREVLMGKSETRNPKEIGRGNPESASDCAHPGGMFDNSPTFQRWVRGSPSPSPEGTDEIACAHSAVPSGRVLLLVLIPNFEQLGYFCISLRDGPFVNFRNS